MNQYFFFFNFPPNQNSASNNSFKHSAAAASAAMLGFVFLDSRTRFALILFHTFLWIPLLRLKDKILTIATVFRLKPLPEIDGGGLLVMKYGELRRKEAEMCSICLTEFLRGDSVCELTNCCHVFHLDCIEKWLEKNRFTCPLCRCVFNIQNPRHEKKLFRFVVPDDNPSCLYYFLQ